MHQSSRAKLSSQFDNLSPSLVVQKEKKTDLAQNSGLQIPSFCVLFNPWSFRRKLVIFCGVFIFPSRNHGVKIFS
jgi:hypothetical protein